MGVEKKSTRQFPRRRLRRSPRLNPIGRSTSIFCPVGQEFLVGGNKTPTSIMDLSLSVCTGLSQPEYLRVGDEHQLDTDAEVVAEAVGKISNESALANSYSASNSSLNPSR